MGDVFEGQVVGDISNDEVVSPEDQSVDVVAVDLPNSVDYLEFDSSILHKFLAPFVNRKSAARMVISRSLRISVVSDTQVKFELCEGVTLMSCLVSCRNNHFPDHKMVDVETFYRGVRSHKRKTYLIYRSPNMYVNFFGGELYIPMFNLDANIYNSHTVSGSPTSTGVTKSPDLLSSIQTLSPILSYVDVSDFDYIFVEPDGIYACNGAVVGRVKRDSFPVVFRRSDISLIQSILAVIGSSDLTISCYADKYFIDSDKFSYVFPKTTTQFVNQYKAAFVKGAGSYFVSVLYFVSAINTLVGLPESSGTVDLVFTKEALKCVFKTRRGDVSTFTVSDKVDGVTSEAVFGVSLKTLLTVIKVFKGDTIVSVTFINDKVTFTAGNKECVIIVKKN